MFLLLGAHSWGSESCCWGEVCSSPLVSQAVDVFVCYWTGLFQLPALVWAHQYPSERPVLLVPSCLWPRKLDSVWSCGEWFSTRSVFDRSVLETLQTLYVKSMIVLIKHSHFLQRQRWAFLAEMEGSTATGGNRLPAPSVCVSSVLVPGQLWTCAPQLQPAIPGQWAALLPGLCTARLNGKWLAQPSGLQGLGSKASRWQSLMESITHYLRVWSVPNLGPSCSRSSSSGWQGLRARGGTSAEQGLLSALWTPAWHPEGEYPPGSNMTPTLWREGNTTFSHRVAVFCFAHLCFAVFLFFCSVRFRVSL